MDRARVSIAAWTAPRSAAAPCITAVVLFLVMYCASLGNEYGGDDPLLVRNARNVCWSFSALSCSFSWEQRDFTAGWVPGEFRDFRLIYFRPLVMASLKLDLLIWGE